MRYFIVVGIKGTNNAPTPPELMYWDYMVANDKMPSVLTFKEYVKSRDKDAEFMHFMEVDDDKDIKDFFGK